MADESKPSQSIRSVLCVEDDTDTCEFLAILLSEFRFEFAHTISDALDKIQCSRYDLYVLDNCLPDGSGIDLCRTIRRRHREKPILFTSGSSNEAEITEALEAGADRYLLKPCEPDELKEIVKELIFVD